MAHLASFNGIAEAIPRLPAIRTTRKASKMIAFHGNGNKKTENYLQEQEQATFLTTRRMALSLASIAVVGTSSNQSSFAEDNGYWITDLLTSPSVENNITNEKTGSRSFVKKGVYVANLNPKNRRYRLMKYAFDLLAMADLIGPGTLSYVKKYLRLKSTVMYYDFDKVISAASADDKQPLTNLATRLFDSFEKLEDAVKTRSLSETESCYEDTKVILQEVMAQMA